MLDTLTHEAMEVHSINGKHLCIHSVVINKNYRRQGLGLLMVGMYVQKLKQTKICQQLLTLRLIAKKHLIDFYRANGFKLVGLSSVVHGKHPWYELYLQLHN